MNRPMVLCRKLRPDAQLPAQMTTGAAGFDLCAAIDAPIEVAPGARVLVPTGLALAIEVGYEGQVRPRSGLALKHGLTVLNAPGTIDADYRGELAVLLVNLGSASVQIAGGDRIAQLVFAQVAAPTLQVVDELPGSVRGAGGFGSTGAGTAHSLEVAQ